MNPLVAHLVSGQILYTGLALMISLMLAIERVTRPGLRRLTLVVIWISGFVAISTAAIPWWAMCLWIASLGFWSARAWLTAHQIPRWGSRSLPIVVSLSLLASDLPWTLRPSLPRSRERAVVVLGDSLSAGMGGGEGTPWPLQLRDSHRVPVHNLAEAGATTQNALRQVQPFDHFSGLLPGLIIVELGGNDLLGGRSCAEYEHDLDKILAYIDHHPRTVVMLELPLLPSQNQWGVVQRRLARKYRCHLIPKRLLVDVLAAPEATVDTLHLSQSGHRRLAEMVWSVIAPAMNVP